MVLTLRCDCCRSAAVDVAAAAACPLSGGNVRARAYPLYRDARKRESDVHPHVHLMTHTQGFGADYLFAPAPAPENAVPLTHVNPLTFARF